MCEDSLYWDAFSEESKRQKAATLSKGSGMLTCLLNNAACPVGEKCFSPVHDDGLVFETKAINESHPIYDKIIREIEVNAL